MSIVERVQDAYGGIDRWRRLKGFTAHVSISGVALPPPDGRPPAGLSHVTVRSYSLPTAPRPKPSLRELVVEGDTATPRLRIYGSTDLDRCCWYTPERVEFHDAAGHLLQAQDEPLAGLKARPSGAPFNQLERGYMFGALVWEAIAGPFLLSHAEARVSAGLEVSQGDGMQTRLAVEWPQSLSPLAPRKVLYLSRSGHLVRSDCALDSLGFGAVIDTISAPVDFQGIQVSTLRRICARGESDEPASSPLIDIEIFDVRFH